MAEIVRCSGTQFDPAAVRAFVEADRKGLVRAPIRASENGAAPAAATTARR